MRHEKNVFLNGIGIGLLVVSIAVLAASAAPEFSAVDKNADGSIDIAEAKQVKGLMEIFGQVDANTDGKLSSAEYAEALKKLDPAGS